MPRYVVNFYASLLIVLHCQLVLHGGLFKMSINCTVMDTFKNNLYYSINALVTVRIDYCNSLLYGLPDCSLSRLQRILNTAARILCAKFLNFTTSLKHC